MLDQEPRDFEQAAETRMYTERVDSTFRWLGAVIGFSYLLFTLGPNLRGLTPLAVYLLCYVLFRVPDIRRWADNRLDMRRARKEVQKIDSEVLKW